VEGRFVVSRALFPYQQTALDWATDRDRIALFMEMRLGKTIVAIRWAQLSKSTRVLVVGPLSVLPGWENELRAEGLSRIYFLRGSRHQKWMAATQPRAGWFLVNYEGLRAAPELFGLKWDVVIADESTRIRVPTAQITKLMSTRLDHVPRRAILSGLPNPESHLDFFCQFRFLNGQFLNFNNYWAFRDTLHTQVGYEWLPKKGVKDRIRSEVREHAFTLRRKDAGIGSRKLYERRVVDCAPEIRRYIRQVKKDFRFQELETKHAVVQATWLRRLAGGFEPTQTPVARPRNGPRNPRARSTRSPTVGIWRD
jgi:SNF2 family DNA or RNA helicase